VPFIEVIGNVRKFWREGKNFFIQQIIAIKFFKAWREKKFTPVLMGGLGDYK
jgi:hypothetical protein